VKRDETVVLFNTGTPLKNPRAAVGMKVATVASSTELVEHLGK
jgi:threonine synthase